MKNIEADICVLTDPYAIPQLSMHRNKQVATPWILICPTLTVVRCKIAEKTSEKQEKFDSLTIKVATCVWKKS